MLLLAFTYVSVGAYFQFLGIERPWLNAIVPAAAFLLSTLTLPFFKGIWERKRARIRSDPTQIP